MCFFWCKAADLIRWSDKLGRSEDALTFFLIQVVFPYPQHKITFRLNLVEKNQNFREIPILIQPAGAS